MQIGRELETHGQSQHQLSAIAKAPGVKIGTGLQLIARVLIVHITVDGYFEPVVAVAEVQALVQIGGACGVLLGISLTLCHVAHIIIIT